MNVGAVLIAREGRDDGRPLAGEGHGVTGLLTVANRPLLQRVTDGLAASGVRDVVVASDASVAPAVRAALPAGPAGVRIRHLELADGARPVAAVLAARELLDDGPVVLHGDDSLVLGGMADAVTAFGDQDLDALQLAVPAASRPRALPGTIALHPRRPRPLGVQILGDRALTVLASLEAGRGCAEALDDLPEAIRQAGGRVGLADHARAWRFSGDVDSFLEVNRLVLERLVADAPPAHLDGVQTQGRVLVDPAADVRASTLRGPLLIGPGAVVRDAYVGPCTCIAAGARVEGAEVEYSVVLPGARISHVGGRIEESVIGAGACVERTFATPTAMRMHVGPGARVALS